MSENRALRGGRAVYRASNCTILPKKLANIPHPSSTPNLYIPLSPLLIKHAMSTLLAPNLLSLGQHNLDAALGTEIVHVSALVGAAALVERVGDCAFGGGLEGFAVGHCLFGERSEPW